MDVRADAGVSTDGTLGCPELRWRRRSEDDVSLGCLDEGTELRTGFSMDVDDCRCFETGVLRGRGILVLGVDILEGCFPRYLFKTAAICSLLTVSVRCS